MADQTRRYDIDWLRVIAIGLLLLYHIGIGFQPWGVLIGFIQNEKSLEALWIPMSLLNIWRIPLLFFVSGMGVSFALRKRTFLQLFLERSRRILIPFLFGIAAIVPLHLFIWQKYYSQDLSYTLQQSHLWFLGNIFSYVLVLSPIFLYLKKHNPGKVNSCLERIYSSPLGFLPVMAFFIVEVILVKPESYEAYASTLHGYLVGLLAFFFGFTFVSTGQTFWKTVKRWRWAYLTASVLLFLLRYLLFDLQAPLYLKAIESVLWIFSAFGFSYRYLNHNSPVLAYLSKAAYPVYILHMIFLYLASYLIMPLDISAGSKFIIVAIFTFLASLISYEVLIRRTKYIRPLFGIR